MAQDNLMDELAALAREEATGPVDPVLAVPLDDAARGRIAARLGRLTDASTAPVALAASAAPAPTRRERPGPRWARRASFTSLAMAVAVTLVMMVPSLRERPELPAYAMLAEGGVRDVRSASPAGEPLRLAPGTKVTLKLQPERDVKPPVAVQVYVVQDQGWRRVEAIPVVSDQGALMVTIHAEQILSSPGAAELVVVLGRPEHLGDGDAPASEENHVQVFKRPVYRK